MEEPNSVDHLNSSLTDLMTSLMVIFILLLLVFVHRTAGKDAAVTDVLLRRLLSDMKPHGFNEQTIRHDPRDRNAILALPSQRRQKNPCLRASITDERAEWSYMKEVLASSDPARML